MRGLLHDQVCLSLCEHCALFNNSINDDFRSLSHSVVEVLQHVFRKVFKVNPAFARIKEHFGVKIVECYARTGIIIDISMLELLDDFLGDEMDGHALGLDVCHLVDKFVEHAVVHHLVVVKVHATGRIYLEDLFSIEVLNSSLAHTSVDGISKQLKHVVDVLHTHDVRLSILLFDRVVKVSVNLLLYSTHGSTNKSLFWDDVLLLIHGK